jgi:hypothetical protein
VAGAGGAAGAIIAARERRIRNIVDAFRLGDATAPDRARRLEDLGIVADNEARDLIVEAVLVPGPREGTYYLSEAGMIYRRDERKGLKAIIAVAVVILALGLLFLGRMTPG